MVAVEQLACSLVGIESDVEGMRLFLTCRTVRRGGGDEWEYLWLVVSDRLTF